MEPGKFSLKARLRSFRHAARGLRWLVRDEHNSWIHLAIVAVLVPVCIILHLSATEWIIITLSIGLVLSMELINSAIERLADKISPGHDRETGKIKDMAAAAVLISAIASAIAGLIILIPKIYTLVNS